MKRIFSTLVLAVLLALPAFGALAAGSHTAKVYFDSNGKRLVVDSGGTLLVNPGGTITNPAGAGTGTYKTEGLLNSQVSATGIGNTADTTDDVLFTYSLPASTLNNTGQSILIQCYGSAAATTNNKTIKLWFGSELISSGVVTTNNKNWSANLVVQRTGASTQLVNGNMIVDTANITGSVQTGAETETGAITIKCTGASGTTGAANDVKGNGLLVEFLNY